MAAGKASVSSTGAAMSKYDVEVEARLKVLEAAVKEIKEELSSHKHEAPASAPVSGDVEARLDDLIVRLGRKMTI
tara:strand:+ start:4292 stop:4516 length:225 start_codon:yes stop_codon:yes gene_type:complete